MSKDSVVEEDHDDSASEAESAGESSAGSYSEDESVQSEASEDHPAARGGKRAILASDPANEAFFAGGNVARLSDNDQTIDANEYEKAMSDELPVVSKTLDYDEAQAGWKESAVTDNNGEYIPFWSSRK